MAQVIIIKKKNKPYYVGLVADISQNEYLKLVNECAKTHEQEEKEKAALMERLKNAEKQIKDLKHEIAVDRGEVEQ